MYSAYTRGELHTRLNGTFFKAKFRGIVVAPTPPHGLGITGCGK